MSCAPGHFDCRGGPKRGQCVVESSCRVSHIWVANPIHESLKAFKTRFCEAHWVSEVLRDSPHCSPVFTEYIVEKRLVASEPAPDG